LLCNDSRELCSCGSFGFVPYGHFAQDDILFSVLVRKNTHPDFRQDRAPRDDEEKQILRCAQDDNA